LIFFSKSKFKKLWKKAFFKRIALKHVYNSLNNPTEKANKKFQKYLGTKLEGYVKKVLPEFESPHYVNSNNYVRTGQQIVLYPNKEYFEMFNKKMNDVKEMAKSLKKE
jgi:hypothetical protein